MTRGLLRAAPGPLARVGCDPLAGVLSASGTAAARASFVAFLPAASGPGHDTPWLAGTGLDVFSWKRAPGGGLYAWGWVKPGPWSFTLQR